MGLLIGILNSMVHVVAAFAALVRLCINFGKYASAGKYSAAAIAALGPLLIVVGNAFGEGTGGIQGSPWIAFLYGGLAIILYICLLVGIVCWRERGVELWQRREIRSHPGKFMLSTCAVVALAAVWTVILFRTQGLHSVAVTGSVANRTNIFLVSLGVAVGEELFYRGYLQGIFEAYLPPARYAQFAACLATSLIFAFNHSSGQNTWVRVMQIFPLGVGCGLVMRRYGIGGAILCHGLFNVWALL